MLNPTLQAIISAIFSRLPILIAVVSWVFWCAACGDTQPAQPSRTVLPVTGTWTGTYQVTSCTANFSVLPCRNFASPPGATNSMRLVLAQTGTIVTGTFDSAFTNAFNGDKPLPVPVSGSLDSSATLRLQGGQPFKPGCHEIGSQIGIDIGDWTTAMNYAGSSLTGVFRQSITGAYIFSCYVGTIDVQSEIVLLTRPLPIVDQQSQRSFVLPNFRLTLAY
jgi:hypothetical protein